MKTSRALAIACGGGLEGRVVKLCYQILVSLISAFSMLDPSLDGFSPARWLYQLYCHIFYIEEGLHCSGKENMTFIQ